MSRRRSLQRRSRPGIALLTALALLTLLGLIVAGSFAGIVLAARMSRWSQTDARLDAAAEYALYDPLAEWRAWDLAALHPGESRTRSPAGVPAGIAATVTATALPAGMVWIVADVHSTRGELGHRRLNLVARLPRADPLPRAAIVSRGDVRLGPAVHVEVDTAEALRCAAVPSADAVLGPVATMTVTNEPGSPVLHADTSGSAADSATYLLDGGGWAALAQGGGLSIAPGDLELGPGSTSGVLLVAGRLTITGPMSISGVVIALGGVVATGGLTLTGALLSYVPVGALAAVDLRDAVVRYAPCTVRYALESTGAPRPAGARSWAELF